MRRRRFFAGGAGLAAAALTGMAASSAADDDALLERLRRGDYAGTPLSRVPDDSESGSGSVWTRRAIAQLKAGAHAQRQARMHAVDGFRADLYAVGGAPKANPGKQQEPLPSLLIVRRGDELTDIAGAIARPNLPDGGFGGMMKQFQPNLVLGMPWTGVMMSAIELAVKAAWPEHDPRIGASSGGRPGAASFFAIKSSVAEWTQTSRERRDQILAAIGSAAGRLYGLTWPNSNAAPATIVIGVEAADPITTTNALVVRISPAEYLASKVVPAMLWQSDGNDS